MRLFITIVSAISLVPFEGSVNVIGLYGSEGLSLALTTQRGLRVFEIMASGRKFGPGREGKTEGWRKLRNDELHSLRSSL